MVVMVKELTSDRRAAVPDRNLGVLIAGIEFHKLDMKDTVCSILAMANSQDKPRYVCTANLDHLALLQHDHQFREIYQAADLVIPDGMPIVWLSHLAPGGPLKERVPGSDLFWELAQASASTGVRIFFLGGVPGAADQAADEVRNRFPGVQVCGTYCPSFEEFGAEAEEARIADAIQRADPQILLVGLGAPKQEKWIAANREKLGIPVSIGVGASFEMASGIVRRAPRWMQRTGLEWSYRLAQEPGRLWRRYLLRDLPLLVRLTWKMVRSMVRSRQ